jgi:hypothetical protein
MPRSRATRAALIFPSIPRTPNPPGIRMPSACSSRRTDCSSSIVSESAQERSIFAPWWKPAWRSASTTER